MPKAVPIVVNGKVTAYAIWCPACKEAHAFNTDRGAAGDKRPTWAFSGDVDKPTFTPSMLIKSGHYARHHKPGDSCWCTYRQENGEPAPFECSICHSVITAGRIRFCDDCTHDLKGQTVDLPDFPHTEGA